MPTQPTKPTPRPCPSCGGVIKQKYFTVCGRCRQRRRHERKRVRELVKAVKEGMKVPLW